MGVYQKRPAPSTERNISTTKQQMLGIGIVLQKRGDHEFEELSPEKIAFSDRFIMVRRHKDLNKNATISQKKTSPKSRNSAIFLLKFYVQC